MPSDNLAASGKIAWRMTISSDVPWLKPFSVGSSVARMTKRAPCAFIAAIAAIASAVKPSTMMLILSPPPRNSLLSRTHLASWPSTLI